MVGKRALPAISLTNDIATLTSLAHRHGWHDVFAYQLRYLAHPQDIAIAISQDKPCQNVLRGLGIAKQMGLLTIALTGGSSEVMVAHTAVDHLLVAPAEERQLVKEMQVTRVVPQ
jgi:D-sedoheptulose 7-phosphate isomerase